MSHFNEDKLILEKEAFTRENIEKRMQDGGFNSLAKFELFVWDLEMFLQLQRVLGDKIILKGGAATQFYIPIERQRTSIDIDMICLASREEVHQALKQIENDINGTSGYCKFELYKPDNPKVGLEELETYFSVIPSVCNGGELYATKGRQAVKIEFHFSEGEYVINRISQPVLFALETEKEFNILALSNLFADKLTTLGPNTIGISEERGDEHFKQIYDVITLFTSNIDQIMGNRDNLKTAYENAARQECKIHGITYDEELLFTDIKTIINNVKNIENDPDLMQRAHDFQSLYLRKKVNRDRSQWAIVGFQLDMLVNYIFNGDDRLHAFRDTGKLVDHVHFEHIEGPERGTLQKAVRTSLENKFSEIPGLTKGLFKKRLDRIIWELATYVPLKKIEEVIS